MVCNVDLNKNYPHSSLFRALLHDPVAYERPDDFLPQRFLRRTPMGTHELDPAVRDPRCAAFGYGRRSVVNHVSCVHN
jgi:cytochrome P450